MLLLLIFDAVERVRERRQRFMHEGKEAYPLPLFLLCPPLMLRFSSTVIKSGRL
jgi:hypothetical protein